MKYILSLACLLVFACPAAWVSAQDAKQPAESQKYKIPNPQSTLLKQHQLEKGQAVQGLALTKNHYFSSTSDKIYRFDSQWKLLQEKTIRVPGVDHIGAIHHHDGHIWAGFLKAPTAGKRNKKNDRAVIAKIRDDNLEVVRTWDITQDVTWIDPVCFDGKYLWVGDLSDLGIHRYRFVDDKIVRDGIFRYPKEMHFSQGIRIVGGKLYSIHTFGSMDGLFEFEIPKKLSNEVNRPTRVWDIQETRMHLEGFDFIPGHPNQIWHCQGGWVDRYELQGLPSK